MKKKGQAALEFLTTYGWALMVLAISLGAIYMFLENKPEKLVPETCSFGDSFNCDDFQINRTNSELSLLLTNVVGTEINVTALSCTYEDKKVTGRCSYTADTCVNPDSTGEDDCCIIAPGQQFTISCDLSGEDVYFKKKSKLDATMIYYKKGMFFPSSSDGTITGNIVN